MVDVKNIRNPIIISIIPIIGLFLIFPEIHNSQQLILIGYGLLFYPLFWLQQMGEYLRKKNPEFTNQTIPVVSILSFIIFPIAIIIGIYAYEFFQSMYIFYLPILIQLFVMITFLIIYIIKFSKEMSKIINLNQNFIFLLIICALPVAMYLIQKKFNEFQLKVKTYASEEIQEYLKTYKTYTKEQLIKALLQNFNLSEEEAKKEFEKNQ